MLITSVHPLLTSVHPLLTPVHPLPVYFLLNMSIALMFLATLLAVLSKRTGIAVLLCSITAVLILSLTLTHVLSLTV